MEILKTTVLLSIGLGVFALVSVQAAEYGQDCAVTGSCVSTNITDPLVCNVTSKICQCPLDMFRHETLNRCVSPHGNSCTLQTGNGEPIKTCTDFAQCWPNEEAGKPGTNVVEVVGTCHCDLDARFDNVTTGRCKLTHGSKRCKVATECDVKASLTCLEGECVCQDQEHQVYDEVKGKCITLVGGSCAIQTPFPTPECGTNMNCTENTCKCLNGYEETASHTCGMKYDGKCTETSDCHPQFICHEFNTTTKLCRCRAGQEYHQSTTTCRILVGETCDANITDFQCTPHASCTQEKCACDDGYKEDATTKKCIALFGSQCSDEPEGIKCNTEEDFLVCNNSTNTCECKANYESNGEEKKCKGFIDEACRDPDGCIANSICSAQNICSCGEKQIKSEDKKRCFALLDAKCNFETECSPTHHLVCIDDSTCGCVNPTLRDDANLRCTARAGQACKEQAGGIECAINATCTGAFICNCDNGLTQNNNGICVKPAGSGSSSIFGSLSLIGSMMLGMLYMIKV